MSGVTDRRGPCRAPRRQACAIRSPARRRREPRGRRRRDRVRAPRRRARVAQRRSSFACVGRRLVTAVERRENARLLDPQHRDFVRVARALDDRIRSVEELERARRVRPRELDAGEQPVARATYFLWFASATACSARLRTAPRSAHRRAPRTATPATARAARARADSRSASIPRAQRRVPRPRGRPALRRAGRRREAPSSEVPRTSRRAPVRRRVRTRTRGSPRRDREAGHRRGRADRPPRPPLGVRRGRLLEECDGAARVADRVGDLTEPRKRARVERAFLLVEYCGEEPFRLDRLAEPERQLCSEQRIVGALRQPGRELVGVDSEPARKPAQELQRRDPLALLEARHVCGRADASGEGPLTQACALARGAESPGQPRRRVDMVGLLAGHRVHYTRANSAVTRAV